MEQAQMAGLFISIVGALCIVFAGPIPRQVHRWHMHAINLIEPVMLTWLVRAIGFTIFVLGLVTMAS